MDFTQQITSAIQDKLDVGQAFPVVYSLPVTSVDLFVNSMMGKLQAKMQKAMEKEGETFVAENDTLGLALILFREGVKLPPEMLLQISEDIIKKSRRTVRFICATNGNLAIKEGGLWYCKLYVDLSQEEGDCQAIEQ